MKFYLFKYKIYLLFFLISLTSLVGVVGLDNISFQNTEWLHQGNDSSLPQMGWHFFKDDIWRFPLGSNPNYGAGLGSSIVFADSIPILSIIFKIFKTYLPNNFQYISFWYFLCFFLQLFFSFKILKKFTSSTLYSFIGSIFFLITPIFLWKLQSVPALAGQWILLFTLYLGLTKKIQDSKLSWIFIIILSSLINFYFMIMILGTYSLLRMLNLKISKKDIFIFIKDFGIIFALLLLSLYVIGYFEVRMVDTMALGFARDKLNLLSIFDAINAVDNIHWSLFLPDIQLTDFEEYEGFNYLGLGQILLLFLSIFLFFYKKYQNSLGTLKFNKSVNNFYLICLFFTLWALSTKISFGSFVILDIPLNKYFYGLLSVVRPTGRLFWIVSYFFLILSLIIIFKCFSKKISISIISFFLVIQIIDTSQGIMKRLNYFVPLDSSAHARDKLWSDLFIRYNILKTTFPRNYSGFFSKFSYVMEKHNIKKTNIVKLARINRKNAAEAKYELYNNFRNKNLSDNTVYLIHGLGHLRHLKNIFKDDDVGFFYRDKVWAMVLNEKNRMNNSDKNKFDNIKFKYLKNNKKYIFDFNEKDNYFGLGWSHNQNKPGAWSEGTTSTLFFRTNNEKEDLNLEIFFKPFLLKKKTTSEFDVYINNQFFKKVELKIKKTKYQKLEIIIKKELVNNGKIKIDFKFKDLKSPYDLLISPDSRKLGILVKSIEIV